MNHACFMDLCFEQRSINVLNGNVCWSMNKLKAHNSKGKGGHIGCSEGFNWNLYRPVVTEKVNSQGREQLHSKISKCSESLRLMSYSNFMIFMKVFFALTNLRSRDSI